MSASTQTTNRPLVIAAIMASMAMVAIEATIVSTVMPQIASELGGLHLYSWVFASFLLAQTAMTVVFGKLSDLYGRKPIMFVGIAIFVIGSVLAGFSWSMPAMICFRLIQGIGAGAIQPVSLTIVGDLYPVRERGKVQGYLASVWAVSAVVGPMIGALIVQKLSWAWIFWVNVPIGLAAAAGFWFFLHEAPTVRRSSIDMVGAVLFTVGIAALMIALTEFGVGNTGVALAWAVLFVVTLVLFIFQERRAADPMVSLKLWGARMIATVNGAAMLAGMVLIGITTFLPMYVQVVLQRSSVTAGLTLTMVMLGWPIGATLTSRTFHRIGLWRMVVVGGALIPLGTSTFALLGAEQFAGAAGRRLVHHRPGHGCDEPEFADPDPGGRGALAARHRYGVERVLTQPRERAGRGVFRRGLQLRVDARGRQHDVHGRRTAAAAAGRARLGGGGCGYPVGAGKLAAPHVSDDAGGESWGGGAGVVAAEGRAGASLGQGQRGYAEIGCVCCRAWCCCLGRVHSLCVRLTPGTPLCECPPLRSSFISLRGAPDANRTRARCWFAADQRLLRITLTSMVCSAQRNKGGAKRGTFAEQSTPSA
jgi:MFS family permease